MAANQAKYAKLEQKSVIKSLVAKKCKPCEIYRRIWDMCGETCFSKKECLQMG